MRIIPGRVKTISHSLFSFNVISTTFLTVLVYASVFISSIIVYEIPPKAPPPAGQHGLDLGKAFRDLQVVAAVPHPYNSHANNEVRAHILSRVTEVSKLYNNVHVVDDLQSNATWYAVQAVYFEGDNILVKIDGSQTELEAILLSAHFDSVSTAPGATDDGMGVATLLQLIDYFAAHTPKRTVIFNINNGEEDGYHGAHAFLQHQWSSLPKFFLNLEGAGSGGRPILFRASSAAVTRAFSHVIHPHGSILSSDTFKQGLIRSGTDFSVYSTQGWKGLDLAFYRKRSFYHTKEDTVSNLEGADPLWNMMEASLMSAIALTDIAPGNDDDEPAVYFDVYGGAFVVVPLRTVFVINIVLVIVGPLVVAAGVAVVHNQGKLHWSWRGWLRFPVGFIMGVGLTFGLATLFAYVNPYIVYSSNYAVAVSLASAAFIGLHGTLALASYWRPIPQQKSITLLQSYVLWWIVLVCDTILVNRKQIGGFFFITFFYIAAFFALIVTLLEHLRLPSTTGSQGAGDDSEGTDVADVDGDEENDTETTPLIRSQRRKDSGENEQSGFWIMEYLILVPFPLILVSQMCVMFLGALPQTLSDGSSSLIVYLGLALACFLLIFPLAPFIHNIHNYASVGLFIVLITTSLYNLFAFPFSTTSPMKVFFSQELDLDTGINSVSLAGLTGFLDQQIIPALPSTWKQDIQCSHAFSRRNLQTCRWTGLTPNSMSITNEWLTFNATLSSPGTASISIKGVNTRSCRIYFDDLVTIVHVNNSTGEIQCDYPMPAEGVKELRLWSRTWDHKFVVIVRWGGRETLHGRVACGWAETSEGRIPAFMEVIRFLPIWARVTKDDDALMEATRKFSV